MLIYAGYGLNICKLKAFTDMDRTTSCRRLWRWVYTHTQCIQWKDSSPLPSLPETQRGFLFAWSRARSKGDVFRLGHELYR